MTMLMIKCKSLKLKKLLSYLTCPIVLFSLKPKKRKEKRDDDITITPLKTEAEKTVSYET